MGGPPGVPRFTILNFLLTLGKGPKVRDKASYIRIRFGDPPLGGSKIGNIERQHFKCWTRRGRKEIIHLGTFRT